MKVVKYIPYRWTSYRWDEVEVTSSTLFGAISNIWVLFYGESELPSFFDAYEKGEIVFSSLFPMIVNGKKEVLFYPKPMLSLDPAIETKETTDRTALKRLKRVRFLSERLFFDLINSIKIDKGDVYYTRQLIDSNIVLEGGFAFYRDELKGRVSGLFSFVEIPHVSIDRLNASNEGRLFFTPELSATEGLGFYFLCRCEARWEEKLFPIFRLLADEGIGGKRSTGKGLFKEVKIEEKAFPKVNNANSIYITLSLVFPSQSEIESIYSLSLVKDDGFVYYSKGISLKKSPLYMLKEGSITKEKIDGMLIEEGSGGISVKRNGKAFLIGSDIS